MKILAMSLASLVFISFASSAQAETCNSRDGAKVTVSEKSIIDLSQQVTVSGDHGSGVVFKGAQGILFSLNCEHGTHIKFEQSSSSLIVICSGHTGIETYSAPLNCQ